MDDLLIPPMEEEKRVSKWATSKEFYGHSKIITPVKFEQLWGKDTTAKAEFRHDRTPEGYTYRLTFLDHDNDNVERYYENCYDDFKNDLQHAKIVKGVAGEVWVTHEIGDRWEWHYKRVETDTQNDY